MFYTDQHNLWYSSLKTADLIHMHTHNLLCWLQNKQGFILYNPI